MRQMLLLLLCALAGAAVQAQTTSPPASPGAVVSSERDIPSAGDPRACLEFPTRQQVIACAEKYRPRRPAARS